MTDLYRVQATWTGFTGAPGYSNFYFTGAANPGAVKSFFSATPLLFPSGLTVTVPNSGDIVDSSSGLITGTWTGTGGGTAVGTNSGTYAGPAGACITWLTNLVVNGRRVRGRTFLVPLAAAAYEADGTITASSLTSLNTNAAALYASTGFCIFRRPPVGAGTGGIQGTVVGHQISDQVAVLRSRRS